LRLRKFPEELEVEEVPNKGNSTSSKVMGEKVACGVSES